METHTFDQVKQRLKLTDDELLGTIKRFKLSVPKFVNGNLKFSEKIITKIEKLYWSRDAARRRLEELDKKRRKRNSRIAERKRLFEAATLQPIDAPERIRITRPKVERRTRAKRIEMMRMSPSLPITPKNTRWYPTNSRTQKADTGGFEPRPLS